MVHFVEDSVHGGNLRDGCGSVSLELSDSALEGPTMLIFLSPSANLIANARTPSRLRLGAPKLPGLLVVLSTSLL
jgi:hypothetical protein